MKIRTVSGFLIILLLCLTQAAEASDRHPDENVLYAQSAVLMDGDSGRILYEKNGDERRPNASTTKILTCILALEKGTPEEIVKVSEKAAAQPKVHLGAKVGERFRLGDLLYSLMLESHNDTAVMIAEHIGGNVERFAELMNQKATEIGCENTHFVTPNGLDSQDAQGVHATTAADLARIMKYCISDSPERRRFLEITETDSYTFWNCEETAVYNCRNHNAFLSMMKGALSGKTGFTAKAGYCYVGALKRDGKLLIVALLACGWPGNSEYKWSDTRILMTYGLEKFERKNIFDATLPMDAIEVREGQTEKIGGRAEVPLCWDAETENGSFTVLLGEDESVSRQVSLPEALIAPVERGTRVGKVTYLLGGEVLKCCPIYAKETVKKIDFIWWFDIIKHKYCMKDG